MLIVGIVLVAVTLTARAATTNRFIRSRLSVSAVVFAADVVAELLLASGRLPPEIAAQIRAGAPLLLAFGSSNAIVALVINPWRHDRIPDRFPNIVQDAIVIGLFAVAATIFLPEKIAATTAVGAVVIGFALQDTLGNLFSGLAIQVEKPFHVGQWVTIGGKDGKVTEITWRATKIRTKTGNFVVVPNSVLSRDTITNYSEPNDETRIEIEVGASYDTPPNDVKTVIRAALLGEPMLVPGRPLDVLVADFGHSAVIYRVRFWITDFAADELVRDQVRTLIYYAFRRHGITIPYPIQVYVEQDAHKGDNSRRAIASSLAGVDILDSLDDEQRSTLVESARPLLYAAGEAIVLEAAPGQLDVRAAARRGGCDAGGHRRRAGATRGRRILRRDVAADRRTEDRDDHRGHRLRAAGNWQRRVPARGDGRCRSAGAGLLCSRDPARGDGAAPEKPLQR